MQLVDFAKAIFDLPASSAGRSPIETRTTHPANQAHYSLAEQTEIQDHTLSVPYWRGLAGVMSAKNQDVQCLKYGLRGR